MTVFSTILPSWQRSKEPWSLEQLLFPDPENPPKYMLQSRDLDVLQLLFEHRFLTTNQISRLYYNTEYGIRSTQRRMKQLFEIGVIMRIRPRDEEPGTKPYVFAITHLGYEILRKTERISQDQAQSIRFDESDHQVEFSRVIHELHLNDVCLSIFEEASRRDLSFEWLPTKLCRQSIKMTNGKSRIVEPDAVFIFYTDKGEKVLHLEYERSADQRRFQDKLTKWKLYRGQQVWRERYQSEPLICVVGSREGWETKGRKRRVVNSIKPLQSLAFTKAFSKICFLPTDEIDNQTWNCLPDQRSQSNTLWDYLGF